MKIIEANEGQKISYSTTKTWLNVLIESDWNLKWEDTKLKTSAETVLIESYWNLRII